MSPQPDVRATGRTSGNPARNTKTWVTLGSDDYAAIKAVGPRKDGDGRWLNPDPLHVLDLDAAEVWRRLHAIPGWDERAEKAQRQADAGQSMSLPELRSWLDYRRGHRFGIRQGIVIGLIVALAVVVAVGWVR